MCCHLLHTCTCRRQVACRQAIRRRRLQASRVLSRPNYIQLHRWGEYTSQLHCGPKRLHRICEQLQDTLSRPRCSPKRCMSSNLTHQGSEQHPEFQAAPHRPHLHSAAVRICTALRHNSTLLASSGACMWPTRTRRCTPCMRTSRPRMQLMYSRCMYSRCMSA